jgi:alpha-1,2-mannosyltransferase
LASNGIRDRLSPRRALVAGFAFVILATYVFSARIPREMADFEVYWRAGIRAAAGEPLYRTNDQHYQFKYLPGFAVLAIPLGFLPLGGAKLAWFAVSVSLLLLLITKSLRLLIELRKPTWLLAVIVVVTMGKFYGHELVLGQVNLLFGVVVVAFLLSLKHGRELSAGFLVATAVVIKPYALVFVPWIAAQRRPKTLVGVTVGLSIALALPLAAYSVREAIALHVQWWHTVTVSTVPNLLNQDNVSLAAMFAKWLGPGAVASWLAVALGLVLLTVGAMVFVLRQGIAFPEGLEGALLLTLIPLLSPQGWDYVFLIATPAVVYLANYEDRLPIVLRVLTALALVSIGLSLFDLLGRANYARFMALSVISLCFLVVIGGLAALRIQRVA